MVLRVAAAVALAAALGVAAASPEGDAKLAALDTLTGNSASLLTLTDKNFEKYVSAANRPYHMFVLFNAPEGPFKCEVCAPFQAEVAVAAASYGAARAKGHGGAQPAFFGVAMFNKNRNAFGKVRALRTGAQALCPGGHLALALPALALATPTLPSAARSTS